MRSRNVIWLVMAGLFCALFPLNGQEARGTLLGRVTDQSDAVIVGAQVETVNTNTGVRSKAATNETGDYILPFLIPGTYNLFVETPGFKKSVREGIGVRVNERIAIDVRMELGLAAESIRVDAETPLLDTSTASMGQVISTKTILEMPLKDGMVLTLAMLSPGVQNLSGNNGWTRPFDTGNPSNLSVDGTRTSSNEFTMDGAPNMQQNQVAYSPPPGVVEEFKIQTATFDASYGFMPGAAMNMSLKSGTNRPHGQVYYFMENPALVANTFFQNRMGLPKADFRVYRWGGSASGPIYLPRLYDGRNRTFWMYGYEGIHSFDPTPYFVESEPSAAQRRGDFSALLALGSQYQIYDPYSIRPAAGGRFSRDTLPGNVIPASRINAVARKIADLWSLPNQTGTADGVNNFRMGKNALDKYYNDIVRIDQNVSEKQRFFVRGNITLMDRNQNYRMNGAVGDRNRRWNRGLAFDHVYEFSPHFFMNTRYSLTRYIQNKTPFQMGWDLAGLGFSSNFIRQIQQANPEGLKLPGLQVSGYSALSDVTFFTRHSDVHDMAANLTTMVRAHTLRYGIGYRVYRENTLEYDQSSGSLDFGSNWTRGPLDNSPAAPMGQTMASFLYGLPTGGYFPVRDTYAEQATTLALYLQDDWKLSRKLTLSIGLRHELITPLTERFNRSVRGFDATSASPIESQARENYAKSPLREVPVDQFRVRGGLTFAGVNGAPRTLWNTPATNFMPRIGLAYLMTPRTVLRAGYGLFYEPIGVVNTHVNQTGFYRQTDFVASLDNGQTYVGGLINPFPNGFQYPLGAKGGLSTNLGQGVAFFDQNLRYPYMQRWQFSLQRELVAKSVIDMSYVGNRGTRQRNAREYNPIPRPYLSTSPVRDQDTINFLGANGPNPFYPLLPGTSLAGANVARSQLLRPYPQFTSVVADTNQAYSWYHSLQIRFDKRFSADLSSSVSYTWSKLMEARTFRNETDATPEEVVSDQDRTHRLAVTWIYQLPFGSGRVFGKSWGRPLNAVLGGWQVQGIYTGQSGPPLGFGNSIFAGDLKNVPFPNSERTVERWFNVNAGFERDSRKALGSNLRGLSSRFAGIRGDGQNNWDLSLIKNGRLTERFQLQFRAEAINALNHAQFLTPNTNPANTAFGQVSAEWSWPRVIQFGIKLLF